MQGLVPSRSPGRSPDNFSGNRGPTDEQGHFRLGGLAAGPYRVRIEAKGETPLDTTVQVQLGMEPVKLSIRAGGTCEVLLLDESGVALSDKIVVIERIDGGPRHSTSGISSPAGAVRFARQANTRSGRSSPASRARAAKRAPAGRPSWR